LLHQNTLSKQLTLRQAYLNQNIDISLKKKFPP
jgi:hypothetical protein